jgi:hypothetical protein
VLEHQSCAGDEECCLGVVFVDTSHVTFLARAATSLGPKVGLEPPRILYRLLRATGCWKRGRLLTTQVAWDSQLDPDRASLVVDELRSALRPEEEDWTEFLAIADQEPLDDVVRRIMAEGDVGEIDTSLAATALSYAYRANVHLLTNDERLIGVSRRAQDRCRIADTEFTGSLVVHPSPGFARVLHACGAFPTPVVEACLLAEFSDLHRRMEDGKMTLPTFRRKTSRLEKIAADLRLPTLEEETPQLDDADVRRLLLGDDDEL